MDDNGEPVAKVEEVVEEVHDFKNSEMLLLRGRGNQAWESSLNASSGGRGRRWLGIQHDRRGVQLFGAQLFSLTTWTLAQEPIGFRNLRKVFLSSDGLCPTRRRGASLRRCSSKR